MRVAGLANLLHAGQAPQRRKRWATMAERTTIVLWGGLDPGGQAGLAADLQVAAHMAADARVVLTAHTAQTGDRWLGAWPVANHIRRQVVAHLELPAANLAIKSGMLATGSHAAALAAFAAANRAAPLVVDPLLASTSGGTMWPRHDVAAVALWHLRRLLPLAAVATPNWPELAWLLGTSALLTRERAEHALRLLPCPALLKGGHAPADCRGVDLLWDGKRIHALHPSAVWHQSPRGTGCRLATALAIELARGRALLPAARAAKARVAAYV